MIESRTLFRMPLSRIPKIPNVQNSECPKSECTKSRMPKIPNGVLYGVFEARRGILCIYGPSRRRVWLIYFGSVQPQTHKYKIWRDEAPRFRSYKGKT